MMVLRDIACVEEPRMKGPQCLSRAGVPSFCLSDRSPYLALLSGLSLMGILGLTTYLAGFTLNSKLTVDVYKVYIVSVMLV